MNKHFLGKCTFVHWYCLALAILLWLPITILEAAPSQNLKVSGIVTSATDGEPLIGVSVQVYAECIYRTDAGLLLHRLYGTAGCCNKTCH